jgi:hypothetical protein
MPSIGFKNKDSLINEKSPLKEGLFVGDRSEV